MTARCACAAQPVDGKADEELIRVLSRALGVAKRDVEITCGHSSKIKQVSVCGIKREHLLQLVGEKA